MTHKPRTLQQNRALHKWCEQLAETLADAGYDMRTLIKVPITPNKDNIKSEIVHPVMRALYPDIESTADLSTTQMQDLYETINRALGEKLGVHVPWPSHEEMMIHG